MKPETRTALDESIAHWEKKLKEYDYNKPPLMDVEDCALCLRFSDRDTSDRMTCELNGEKCPVFVQAFVYGCVNTPYEDCPTRDEMVMEIDFLESLREE